MFSHPALSGYCICVLRADLGESPRSGILLVLKVDGELLRFVISFMLGILSVVLYSCLCLVFL